MEALEAIAKRTSSRKFKEIQISEDNLQTILKAGMSAPVGSGAYDSLHILIVQNQNVFSKINAAVTELIFKMTGKKMDKNFGAPTMIFVSSKPAMMPGLEYANTACVLENMAIAATSLGIDNIIWGGAAAAVEQNAELQKILEIPEGYKPILCISLGYASENEIPKKHEIAVNKII